jgi:hypothetical protein
MPRGSSSEIRDIVSRFVGQLSALIEQDAVSRARDTILSAFSGGDSGGIALSSTGRRRGRPPGRRGRPPGIPAVGPGRPPGRKRRKAPIQLCPVPGCTNRAAPVFGMVCSKHKDLPKAEIKKYREARRARRDQPAGRRGGKRGPRAASKSVAKAARKTAARKTATAKAAAAKTATVKSGPKPVASAA